MTITSLRAISRLTSRRRVLRGMLDGAVIGVGLPLLDCFLNENGTALAASGSALPVRFCNWFWGLGFTPGLWEPAKIGPGYDMADELRPLEPYKSRINIFSGFDVYLDGNEPVPHFSGYRGILTGTCGKRKEASVDSIIANTIGLTTRFHSIEVAATGNPASTVSRRSASVSNTAEVSPLRLYSRIFGPDFQSPNAGTFTPDPRVMVHKSVLSTIKDQRLDLSNTLGSADHARLDEYFTSLRQLERQLETQLRKPAPLEACAVPLRSGKTELGTEIEATMTNHRLMAGLLAHALACDQTRVINMVLTDATSSLRKSGEAVTHHILSHDESIDANLGYQPEVKWFNDRIVDAFRTLISIFDSIREGDGTLLDHMLVFASTESGYAKTHTLDNIPMLTAGLANGRIKSGLHIATSSHPVTRVGLTLQQVFGVLVSDWGAGVMNTDRTVTEVFSS